MFAEDVKYAEESIQKIVGGKITSAISTPDKESYGFLVQNGKKEFACWIQMDPENNGPGFISIEESPTPAKGEGGG